MQDGPTFTLSLKQLLQETHGKNEGLPRINASHVRKSRVESVCRDRAIPTKRLTTSGFPDSEADRMTPPVRKYADYLSFRDRLKLRHRYSSLSSLLPLLRN